MYGGVAQRYILWKIVGEPYKKGKAWYIKMEHPATKIPTEVRWYTDKAHADLMPKPKGHIEKFPGEIFGFSSKDDYILAFRERDLTKAEEETYFQFNWEKGGKWKYGAFLSGVWYAPKDAIIPPVGRADRCFRITWPEMVKAGQAHCAKINGANKGWWFNMEV